MMMNYDSSCQNYSKYIDEYIQLVENNPDHFCIEQKLLVKLIKKILLTEKLVMDVQQIEKYFSYQKYFSFSLFEWEKFLFVLHDCLFKVDGLPRFPTLFILGGRGLGKNGFLAFEDFCLITPTNGIRNYNIDISANSEDQAKITFDDIYEILENPKFKKKFQKNFKWTQTKITNIKTNSTIRFRTNNPKGKDGLRPGKVDFDEPHQYENWENIKVFTTALGKVPHPRRTYVSTNGDVRDGPLDNLIEKSEMILNGEVKDNGFLPFICKLDDEVEVDDEEKWQKANPSLLYLPNLLSEIQEEYIDYKQNPIVNSSFMTKRMNIPKSGSENAVATKEDLIATNREIPDLSDRDCLAGLDLMKKNDFLSACLLFKLDSIYYVISHTWVCKQSADLYRIRAPLKEWQTMGLLDFVDDVEIDPQIAVDWLLEISNKNKYHIKKIAADNYRYNLLKDALQNSGLDTKEVRVNDKMRIAPIIDSAFTSKKIVFGNNPLLRWAVNNTMLIPAVNGNFKYEKQEAKSRKNDPFMALVHAFCLTEEFEIDGSSDFKFFDTICFDEM